MAHDRNLGVSEGADQLDARAFNLDCFGSGFLHETDGVGQSLGYGTVIAAEGHVGDHQRAAHGAANGAGVMQHLVHGDGQGVVVAQNHHGQRIAHQQQVDAGLICQARR
jgi:hypothetical protein